MMRSVKPTRKRTANRDLFSELKEGMDALAEARQGKRTLRTHSMEFKPPPTMTPQEVIRVRKNLKLSARTLENWEQGAPSPTRKLLY
jgi:putative transcriptional regulator